MYIYRGAKELEAIYEFASTSFWRTTKEDTYDIPIRKIVIKEEDMTMWQYFWKKVYDVDGWVDEQLEDSDFDIIPKPIRYSFLIFVAFTSFGGIIFVTFFDD